MPRIMWVLLRGGFGGARGARVVERGNGGFTECIYDLDGDLLSIV